LVGREVQVQALLSKFCLKKAHEAGDASTKLWWKIGSLGLPARRVNEQLVGLPFPFDVGEEHFSADTERRKRT
jgi:hypothetical protein